MHFALWTALLTLSGGALAQISATSISQLIGVTGNTGRCQVQATFQRPDRQAVTFISNGDCGRLQDNGGSFEEIEGIEVRFSCDVLGGQCGNGFEIEVRAPDGECGIGTTDRVDCPTADFRRGRKRQDLPTNSASQCYGDIVLGPC